ncbi:DeoR/GlpR family DNA-binding transcription regulator [Clostridium arbusti]|uniref:DeoR/GlpR family DNA-binding transcription regulator n=1 Tax=Clostridium arbusti TaxID=1137848 RepID=UPI00028912AF|nr:DeoR/GlpR family DNA-binding transcription regulator [Clostridium arbusti]
MYQEERLLKILEYLNGNNNMSIHTICEMFSVSRDTARRDIIKLIEQGTAIRTHGGISLPTLKTTIEAYRERLKYYSEEKRSIANKALEFIDENKHYFFDVSTTVSFLAEYINKSIIVVTHSLDNIEIFSDKKDVSVYSIGGCLNNKNRFFYKPGCINYLQGMRFDAAFIGAAAINEDGIYYDDYEDAFIKQAAVKKSCKVIVLTDCKKFKLSSYYKGVNWDQVDVIITDSKPPKIFIDIIEKQDIQLIIAD